MNTYSSERDIDDARARALKVNQDAIRDAEQKLGTAQKRQQELKGELEFYQKKPVPVQLKREIQANELQLKAQAELLDAKRRETIAINAKYDEDKTRYSALTKAGTTAPAAAATAQR